MWGANKRALLLFEPYLDILITSPLAKNQIVAKVFTQDYHMEAEKSEII